MSRPWLLASVLLAIVVSGTLRAQQNTDPPANLMLTVRYVDGRLTQHAIGPTPGRIWTPLFPRLYGWTPAAGQTPIDAIQYSWNRTEGGVQVIVSVLRFKPSHQETPIATVTVRADAAVPIDALRLFGAEAVQLSLSPAPRVTASLPLVTSAVAGIAVIGVELAPDGGPRYLVTLKNAATVDLRIFSVDVYRGGRLALSGGRRGPEGRPIIDAGAIYTFDVPISMSTSSNFTPVAQPADEIRIASALWTDGAVDGNVKKALETVAVDYGMFLQLTPVIDAHRRAAADAPADPRAAIEQLRARTTSLSIDPGDDAVIVARLRMRFPDLMDAANTRSLVKTGMDVVRTGALRDLAALEETARTGNADDVARALSEAADRYAAWRSRLAR
ncbi:MAG TPA: hypothetical protein VFV98_15620 [Vicinamibacterales bacterium]|nr:hypothetical protein [Vicinamibacterales bacterium]